MESDLLFLNLLFNKPDDPDNTNDWLKLNKYMTYNSGIEKNMFRMWC